MKAKIKAGAEIEFVSPAELKASENRIVGKMVHEFASLSRAPIIRRLYNSGKTSAAGVVTIDLDRCPTGYSWDARAWRVMGPDESAISGACFMYRNEVQPSNYLDDSSLIPNVSNAFGTHGATLLSEEHLVAHITGAPPNTVITVNAQVIEELSTEIEQAKEPEEI